MIPVIAQHQRAFHDNIHSRVLTSNKTAFGPFYSRRHHHSARVALGPGHTCSRLDRKGTATGHVGCPRCGDDTYKVFEIDMGVFVDNNTLGLTWTNHAR